MDDDKAWEKIAKKIIGCVNYVSMVKSGFFVVDKASIIEKARGSLIVIIIVIFLG